MQVEYKGEIKAAYGYGKIYSIPAVSPVYALNCSSKKQEREPSERQSDRVKFEDVLKESLGNKEVTCSIQGYGKSGAYEEYLYLKREYRF